MTTTTQLGQRGNLTLPKKLRDKFGLTSESILILEDTDQGILIRPAAVFPIEAYSDTRLAEFEEENNTSLATTFPPIRTS